jgi:hypothetical protein
MIIIILGLKPIAVKQVLRLNPEIIRLSNLQHLFHINAFVRKKVPLNQQSSPINVQVMFNLIYGVESCTKWSKAENFDTGNFKYIESRFM